MLNYFVEKEKCFSVTQEQKVWISSVLTCLRVFETLFFKTNKLSSNKGQGYFSLGQANVPPDTTKIQQSQNPF